MNAISAEMSREMNNRIDAGARVDAALLSVRYDATPQPGKEHMLLSCSESNYLTEFD